MSSLTAHHLLRTDTNSARDPDFSRLCRAIISNKKTGIDENRADITAADGK